MDEISGEPHLHIVLSVLLFLIILITFLVSLPLINTQRISLTPCGFFIVIREFDLVSRVTRQITLDYAEIFNFLRRFCKLIRLVTLLVRVSLELRVRRWI